MSGRHPQTTPMRPRGYGRTKAEQRQQDRREERRAR